MEIGLPSGFEDYHERVYWGISNTSLILTNNALLTDSDSSWKALKRYHELTILRTNYQIEWEDYKEAVVGLCKTLFCNQPPLHRAAICVNPQNYRDYVAGSIYHLVPSGSSSAITKGQEKLDAVQEGEEVVLPKRELRGYVDEEEIKLLRSLNIIEPVINGYKYDKEILRSISRSERKDYQTAAWNLTHEFVSKLGVDQPDKATMALLRDQDISVPESTPDGDHQNITVYLMDSELQELTDLFFGDDFQTYLNSRIDHVQQNKNQLLESLQFRPKTATAPRETEWPLSKPSSLVCATASQISTPVSAKWVVEKEDADDSVSVHTILRDSGIEAVLKDGMLYFEESYEEPKEVDEGWVSEYQDWIYSRINNLDNIITDFKHLLTKTEDRVVEQRREMMEVCLDELEDFTIGPTKFIYTIFDPEYHADKYDIDEYVGDSPYLEDEVDMMRKWAQRKPSDAVSFADMVPEVLNYPIEEDDVAPRLRIMSPWMNFAIQDYAAIINRLLKNDVRIQLLFRLPDSHDWNSLKNNLLTRIGDTGGNLELRTYTRYKKFRNHVELSEIDDEESDRRKKETGIHAKLYIAGDHEKGSLLAGSANLMENSFYYNPEAGLQTHNPNVIQTASEYFDLVWKAAEPDKIPASVFRGETQYSYYPKVYRP